MYISFKKSVRINNFNNICNTISLLSMFQQRPVKQSFCSSLRRDTHWKCLILTLLICGCLAAIIWCRLSVVTKVVVNFYDLPIKQTNRTSPCDDGYVYIPVAFVVMLYLVYLVECWHCHTRIELQYKVDVNTVYEKIAAQREALPIVWWKAVCYHYVRRTRQVTRYRNGDAFTTTQVYYERVNSHTASSAFNFGSCGMKDISKNLVHLEDYPATKIKFSKGFSFASGEAENEFEEQRSQFFQEHERRDDYMETREGLDLLNVSFKEYMITFADPDNLPWYISHVIFWVASVLMLSWPLRVIIEYKTAHVHYHVHKLFGTNYVDPTFVQGTMSRVSTMGSSELEMSISNNNTIVPSYSEALLMESQGPNRIDANGNVTPGSAPSTNRHLLRSALTPSGLPSSHFFMGYIHNGFFISVPNGHVSNGCVRNGSVPSGNIPNCSLPRSESDFSDIAGRRKRKWRRKQSRQTPDSITDFRNLPSQYPDQRSAPITTVAPTLPTTPETPESGTNSNSPLLSQRESPCLAPVHSSLPPINHMRINQEETGPAVSSSPRREPMRITPFVQRSSRLRNMESPNNCDAIPPPSYDVALTMRVAESIPSDSSSLADSTELHPRASPSHSNRNSRTSIQIRCMETSL